MAPVRVFTDWNSRPSDSAASIQPYRRYYIISEGANTEFYYFKGLQKTLQRTVRLHSGIQIFPLEKTDADRNLSDPKKLINFAEKIKKEDISFDKTIDRMVIVFDADIFQNDDSTYNEIIRLGERNKENILGVTNPSFELFLFLHYQDSYEQIIVPNAENILKNEKNSSGRRFIDTLFSSYTRMNPKKNKNIDKLSEYVDTAIKQEKKLNQNIYCCSGKLTSNIGKIIQSIMEDEPKFDK